MSEHAQTVTVLAIHVLIGAGALAFVGWLLWTLFWDLYDHLMQQRTRRRNTRFEARVGRDCYHDRQGITR